MAPLAEAGFRSLAPDWIGHGYSAKPEKKEFAYTPDAFLAAFEKWIEAMELERFTLVVQGFLGSVGLLYAAKHPEAIERLVIVNTPLTDEAKLPLKIAKMGWPLMGEVMTQDPLLVDRTLEGGGGYVVPEDALGVYRKPFLTSSAAGRALKATIGNLNLPETTAEIAKGFATWEKPVLVAWGKRDPWLPLEQAQAFAKTLPNGTLEEFEEVGHYPQEDWHEKVSGALVPFLRAKDL